VGVGVKVGLGVRVGVGGGASSLPHPASTKDSTRMADSIRKTVFLLNISKSNLSLRLDRQLLARNRCLRTRTNEVVQMLHSQRPIGMRL